MKILYIGWGFSPFRMGGSLRYAESVMEGMAARGNTVGYFCSGRFSLLPRRISTLKTWSRGAVTMFEVRDSPIVPGWGLGTKNPRIEVECPPLRVHLETVLAEFRPEIVHVHDLHAMSADLVCAVKARGIPVLYSLHDYGPLCPTFFLFRHDRVVCEDYRDGEECVKCSAQAPRDAFAFRCALGAHSLFGHRGGAVISVVSSAAKAFLRKASAGGEARDAGDAAGFVARRKAFVEALSSADLLLPVSRRVANLYSAYGVAGPMVRVLHPLLPHHEKIRRVGRAPRSDGKVRFGYLGALMPAKGIEVLLEAYGRMERKGDAELRLHGPCDARYRQELARRFPEGMAGYRGAFRPDQLQGIRSGIDVGVFPSVCEETYGMVAVEFLRAGIPVIASRIGGIPEVVLEGEGGILFPPGDPAALSSILDALAASPSRIAEMGRNGRPGERFEAHLDRVEGIYVEAIG